MTQALTTEFLAGLCFVSVVAGASWLGGLVVFAPLHERTLLFKVRNRFRIADLVALAILLQLAAGVMIKLTPRNEVAARAVLITLTLIIVVWWTC